MVQETLSQPSMSLLEQDALIEIFNIGIGKAAFALNRLTHEEVTLSIPQVELMRQPEAFAWISSQVNGHVIAIRQSFRGEFNGNAFLLFPQDQSLNLVRTLLAEYMPLASLSELEQEALIEVGNLILNACFGMVSNILELNVEISVPELRQGRMEDVFPDPFDDSWSLLMKIMFDLPSQNANGYVNFVMDLVSLSQFNTGIKNFLQRKLH